MGNKPLTEESVEILDQSKEMTTFSIRLTSEQRERLVQAAEKQGWSPTNLIRTAALERAAHILNTTRPSQINFDEEARKICRSTLFGKKTI